MSVRLLVEGPSELAFFGRWTPRLRLGDVRVYGHEGKGRLPRDLDAPPPRDQRQLLVQLPAKLRGFASQPNAHDLHVVVIVDADDDDPARLTKDIEDVARAVAPNLRVTVRLAVEETEAFYLGDRAAIRNAYPDADFEALDSYEQDSICGTWELFGRIIRDGGGNKVAWAEAMGPLVTTEPARHRSPSFKDLVGGLRAKPAGQERATPPATRKYRHPTKNRTDSGRRR